MSSNNPENTIEAPSTTRGPAGGAPAATARVNRVDAISRLHAELDGISRRPVGDFECRRAMLDCVLRCRGLVGGAWFVAQQQGLTADVSQLPNAIFQRKDVAKWLSSLAQRSLVEQTDLVSTCPMVRNVRAICVPVLADRRSEVRDKTEANISFPPRVLVLAMTNSEGHSEDAELLAAQCVVRAWRDWYLSHQVSQSQEQLKATAAILDLTGRMNRAESEKAASQVLVNALQSYFDARFVALGIKKETNVTCQLRSVSGVGDFDPNAQQAARLESALNEAIVRDSLTSHPCTGPDQHQQLAHKRVCETFGVDAVLSIPLLGEEDQVIGAVSIGGQARTLLNEQTSHILQSARRPLGRAVRLSQRLEGGLLRRSFRKLQRWASRRRGQLMLATLAVVIGTMFIPVSYRIHCRCTVEPVLRRFSLAPYDGMLENTFVEPGDEVHAGELVARMEGRELSWELSGLTAESERARKQRDVHMAELAVADSLMSELEMEKLTAREQLLKNRLEKLELRSPVDGIVLGGSLDRREHYPVTTGQVVYEIAPLDPLRIEVGIPADERPHVEPGMTVEIRIDGSAGTALSGQVKRILPRSEIRDEQNVFVAEVIVSNPNGDLRPGMEGAVRVTGDKHAMGWTLGHRAWERLMTKVWW